MESQVFEFKNLVFFVFIGFALIVAPVLLFINSYEDYKSAETASKVSKLSVFKSKFTMLIAVFAFIAALILSALFILEMI